MAFLLHLEFASGGQQTLTFTSAFSRALAMIVLSSQPVVLRIGD